MQKLPKSFQVLIVVTIGGALLLAWILSPQIPWEDWQELLLFVVLIAIAAMLPIPDLRGGAITATPTLFYVLFTVHGPGAGILIGSTAYVVGSAVSRNWVPWRRIYNGAQMGIGAALGGLVFRSLGGTLDRPDPLFFLLPFAAGALAHQLTNTFFVSLFFSRLRNTPILPMWLSDIRDFLWSDILSIPSAALLAILYVSVHPAILLIYLASLPLQRWAIQLYLDQKRMLDQAIDSLVVAIDSDFPEGRGHSRRVASTALGISKKLNLPEGEIEIIEMGALLHDVGMIGIVDTAEKGDVRAEQFKEHVTLGAEIARSLPSRGPAIAEVILFHHERFDGNGFPRHLSGSQIPFGARIVSVAEAYESMIASDFASNDGKLSPSQAVNHIKGESGKAYDPRVVSAFLKAFEEGAISSSASSNELAKVQTLSESGATG
jgi:putative nucleotidyltransferase with HDIG domain